MATTGGDFLELRVSHPTLGEHTFYPKANEGNNLDRGGVRTNDDNSQVTGSGEAIWQMNMTRGSLELLIADDLVTRKDSDFATKLSASPVPGNYTGTHISGAIFGFVGKPVGDIVTDMNAATFTLKMAISGAVNQLN